jgi:hypothetical protein
MRIESLSRRRHVAVALLSAAAAAASPSPWRLSDPGRRALEAVSADSLRGHLSFLASDALGGRATPSPGQEVAAEYIAAQFRGASLEPLGDDGYFQTAPARIATPRADGFRFLLAMPERKVELPADAFQMTSVEAVAIEEAEVMRLAPAPSVPVEGVAGRVVLTDLDDVPSGITPGDASRRRQQWVRALSAANPALVVALSRTAPSTGRYFETAVVLDPPSAFPGPPPRIVLTSSPALAEAYRALAPGRPSARITVHVPEPRLETARLRNVAGLLRGSDPALSSTYLLITAHYDGTGPQPGGTGPDRIWNAANDDGSGTVTLIELAHALRRLSPRPRRSIVFLAFFGEEKGLRGSAYYAAHPLVPLAKTVADLNLEHLGRTDSTEGGSRAGTASLTGFDYSDVPAAFQAAGRETGIDVYRDKRRSDAFFQASDNFPLASAGVVAHTLCVVFEDFADYHGPADEWPKIDFPNLERTARMVGAAALMIADASEEPRWRADVPQAAPFAEAWRRLRGSASGASRQ